MSLYNEDAIKCLVVGDTGVGKTGMIIRYIGAEFHTVNPQIIFDPVTVEAFVGPTVRQMTIFDTSCQGAYDRLRHLYYPETDVFLVCCSTLYKSTLESARNYWVPTLLKAVPEAKIILVGTKEDARTSFHKLDTVIEESSNDSSDEMSSDDSYDDEYAPVDPFSYKMGMQVAHELKAHAYIECSAKTGNGLKNVFSKAIVSVMDPVTGQRRHKKLSLDSSRTQSLPLT